MGAWLVRQAGNAAARMEVAGARVLLVGHRRRLPAGYPCHRVEQSRDVGSGGIQAGAGPDGSGHRAAVAVAYLVPVTEHLLAAQAQEPHQVRMCAEAAVPDADRLLGGQSRGHQRVGDALDGEGGDWQRLGRSVPGPRRRTPGIEARPSRSDRAIRRSWLIRAGQPIAVSVADRGVQGHGADDVRGPGLLPFGRVGPQHLVEVDEVDGTAPGQEWVPLSEGAPGPTSTPAPNGAYILWPLQARKSASAGSGRCGASCAASTTTGMPRCVGGGDDARRAAASSR